MLRTIPYGWVYSLTFTSLEYTHSKNGVSKYGRKVVSLKIYVEMEAHFNHSLLTVYGYFPRTSEKRLIFQDLPRLNLSEVRLYLGRSPQTLPLKDYVIVVRHYLLGRNRLFFFIQSSNFHTVFPKHLISYLVSWK